MIDCTLETLIPFATAGHNLPGRPSHATIHRWRLRGVRGVKLDSCLIGGRRYTSIEALQRFSDALTAQADGAPPTVRTPKQRERAIEAARRELARP